MKNRFNRKGEIAIALTAAMIVLIAGAVLVSQIDLEGITGLAISAQQVSGLLIDFTDPTPANDTSTTNTSVEINISITEANLDTVIWNWNGTNFTIYNDSIVLMMNFDNVSVLGENSTYAVDVSGYGNDGTIIINESGYGIWLSNDSEVVTDSAAWKKWKTLSIPSPFPENTTINVRFDYHVEHDDRWCEFQLGRNNQRINSTSTGHVYNTAYLTKSQNISGINDGDTIELWVQQEGGGWNGFIRNFRIYRGYSSGATWTNSGKYGKALSFEGVEDYVEIPDDVSLNFGSNDFTLSVWIKSFDVANTRRTFIEKRAPKGYLMRICDATSDGCEGKILFNIDDDTTAKDTISNDRYDDNQWHQVIGVRDGNYLRIYVDGSEAATATDISGYGSLDNSLDMYLGSAGGTDAFFNGTIDEVRIYNRSLTADEITQHYYSNLRKYDTDKWSFYSNQSNLSVGNYTYFGYAEDTNNNSNMTDIRSLEITAAAYCGDGIVNQISEQCDIPDDSACPGLCLSNCSCKVLDAKMHYPQYPNSTGQDVQASYWSGLYGWLADDWQCNETGNITDVHFWGSWYQDTVGDIHGIHLSIHNDTPAAPPLQNYSMPFDPPLWECYVTDFNVSDAGTGNQGWFEPPGSIEPLDHLNYHRIDIEDLSECVPFTQQNGTIYWLDVWVNVSDGWWGWKTTGDQWNDAAVYYNFTGMNWEELKDNVTNQTYDLAFAITSEVVVGDITAPLIEFVDPTPANGTSTTNTSVEINISIIEENLDEVIWNWNSTNYTFYDGGLKLMMNFDNYTRLNDTSNYGHNGTLVDNAFINTTFGKYGGSLELDGSGDYASIPSSSDWDFGSNDFAFEAWFNADDVSSQRTIFASNSDFWLGVFLSSSTMKYFASSDGSSWNLICGDCGPMNGIGSNTLSASQWHHLIFTRKGNNWLGYIDGELDLNVTVAGTLVTKNEVKNIGRWGNAGYWMDGNIDEFRIWNRSLSDDEVRQVYRSNLRKYDTDKWSFYSNQSNLSVGDYTYFGYAEDDSGNSNMTEIGYLTVDLLPAVTLVSPANGYQTDVSEQTMTCSVSDSSGLANLTLYIWNSTETEIYSNTTQLSGTSNQTSWTYNFTYYNTYKWNCKGYDVNGNSAFAPNNYTLAYVSVGLIQFNSSYDGYIYGMECDFYWPGGWCVRNTDSTTMQAGEWWMYDAPAWAYTEFNTSSLPDSAVIAGVNLTLTVVERDNSNSNGYIKKISQPTVAYGTSNYENNYALVQEIINNAAYETANWNTRGTYDYDLGSTAISDLGGHKEWFAVGLRDSGIYEYNARFNTSEAVSGNPILKVYYHTDTTPPNVSLVSPAENATISVNEPNNVTLIYNVSDDGFVQNCSLYINETLDQTDTSITKNTNQTFSVHLEDGDYNWRVKCTNGVGLIDQTVTQNFTVDYNSKPGINLVWDNSNETNPTDVGTNVTFWVNWSDVDSSQARIYVGEKFKPIQNGGFETGDFTYWTSSNAQVTSSDANTGTYSLDMQRYIYGDSSLTQDVESAGAKLCLYAKGHIECCCDHLYIDIKDNAANYQQLDDLNCDTYGSWTKICYDITSHNPVQGVRLRGYNDIADVSTMLIDDICIADAGENCIGGVDINTRFCNTSISSDNPQTCNYTALESDNTTEEYYVKVCDNKNACSNVSSLQYFDVNHAPDWIATVPNKTWQPNTNETINLTLYFNDTDYDDMNWTAYQPQNITIEINNNTGIATLIPDTLFAGVRFTNFTAYDEHSFSDSGSISNTLQLTVDTPAVITIVADNSNSTNPTAVGDDVEFVINFTDNENDQQRLYVCDTNSITSSGCAGTTYCSASYSTSPVSCNYTVQYSDYGEKTYYTRLCDLYDVCSNVSASYTWNANHYPEYTSTIPTQKWETNDNVTIGLDSYFTDPDTDDMNWTAISNANITVIINNATDTATLVSDIDWHTIGWVIFTAYDPYGLTNVSNNISLIVNMPPNWTAIPVQEWNEDTEHTLNLTDYSSDYDDDDLNYTVTSAENITITIDNDTTIATLIPDTNWYGVRYVNFTAYDWNDSTTSNNVLLNVTSVNDNPEITALYDTDDTVEWFENSSSDWTSADKENVTVNDENITLTMVLAGGGSIASNATPSYVTGGYSEGDVNSINDENTGTYFMFDYEPATVQLTWDENKTITNTSVYFIMYYGCGFSNYEFTFYNYSSGNWENLVSCTSGDCKQYNMWINFGFNAVTTDKIRLTLHWWCDALAEWDVIEQAESGGYKLFGYYISNIFDANASKYWANLTWSYSKPNETNISIQVRASNNQSDLGNWSSEINDTIIDLETLNLSGRYLQYKINLETTNVNITPAFFNITTENRQQLNLDENVSFRTDWQDNDTVMEVEYGRIYICSHDAVNESGCSSITYCNTSNSVSQTQECSYNIQIADVGSNTYYAFVLDDSNANSSSLEGIFSVASAFGVALVSPADATYDKIGNIIFNCSGFGYNELKNLTLYVWNSTGDYYSNTKEISGLVNSSSWQLSNMPEESYEWNCLVYDNASQSEWGDKNYTLYIDKTDPSVELISPADNYTEILTPNITFTCNAGDNFALNNLTLYVWNSTGSNIYTDTTQISGTSNSSTFDYQLPANGNYNWNCKASDMAGSSDFAPSNYSLTFTLDVFPPVVNFVSPTPEDNETIYVNYTTINVTVNENVSSCILVWDPPEERNIAYTNGTASLVTGDSATCGYGCTGFSCSISYINNNNTADGMDVYGSSGYVKFQITLDDNYTVSRLRIYPKYSSSAMWCWCDSCTQTGWHGEYYNHSSSNWVAPSNWSGSGENGVEQWYEKNLTTPVTTDKIRIQMDCSSHWGAALGEVELYTSGVAEKTITNYTMTVNNADSSTSANYIVTNLSEDINYIYWAWCNDTSGNANQTENRSLEIGAAPFCGDGIKQLSEQCDAPDDHDCPGLCLSNCTCKVLDAKMHFPQYPNSTGQDVQASYNINWSGLYGWLADDWQCNQTGNITDVHFWGSWYQDTVGDIHGIYLSIHEDIPDPDGAGPLYSMPFDPPLWQCYVTNFNVSDAGTGDQGWFEPPGAIESSDHLSYHRIDIEDLSECDEFIQQNNAIYWLDVWVNVSDGWWGWKTTTDPWNDAAVYYDIFGSMNWEELKDNTNQTYDLAFAITSEAVEEVTIPPNTTNFNVSYGSTNFSAVADIENVTNLTLATQYGKIQFPTDYGINASGEDYDAAIEIGDGFVSVNTSALDSSFNASANLTLNNVSCSATIYYGEGVYTSSQQIVAEGNVCDANSDPSCTDIHCVGNNLIFTVSHFSGFGASQLPTLDAVSLNPIRDKYNAAVNVSTVNANDPNNDNLTLRCGTASGVYDLCNSTAGQPERSCIFNSPWSDDVVHYVRCIVSDGSNDSAERQAAFTADNTAPITLAVVDVEDDGVVKYWDVVNNGKTRIRITLNETGIRCRWNLSNYNYSGMSSSAECDIIGSVAGCNVSSSVQINETNAYIACEDQYGNDQNISQTINVSYGVDYTAPWVLSDNNNIINLPGYNVTLTIYDIPYGTNVYAQWCNDTDGNCAPITSFSGTNNTNYTLLSFNLRGPWYLRWNSSDEAGNRNTSISQTIVRINRLPIIGTHSYTNYTGHVFRADVDAYDPDGNMQNLTCSLYHRLTGVYNNKTMLFVGGLLYNGTWAVNISMAQGYSPYDLIESYVNCTDGLEYTINSGSNNTLPNYAPSFTDANDNNATLIKGGSTVTINTTVSDVDVDTLKLFVCNSTNVNNAGCIDGTYCSNVTAAVDPSCGFASEMDNGLHYWYAFIYDQWNASALANFSGNYTTDISGPNILLISPVNNSNISNQTPEFRFNAVDNYAYLMNCTLYVNDTDKGNNDSVVNATNTNIVSGVLSEGDQTWFVNCTDSVGNMNKSEVRDIRIDVTPPNSTIINPADSDIISQKDIPYNITGNANDNIEVRRVELNISGSLYNATGITDWNYIWNVTIDGTYTLQSIAIDTAENIEINIEDVIVQVFTTANITNSTVINSIIINSTIDNCTVINSSLIDVSCVNSSVIDSTYINATIINSNDSGSTQHDGYLYVDPSDLFNNSYYGIVMISDSTVHNSFVDDSNISDSLVNRSVVNNSDINNSNITNNLELVISGISGLNELIVRDSNINNSNVDSGNVTYDNYTYQVDTVLSSPWPLINIYAKCGDTVCAGDNTCGDSNIYPECNTDCSSCPVPPVPPAPGAGPTMCIEKWNCSDWGECMPDGRQYRTCDDLRRCEESYTARIAPYIPRVLKPDESKDCGYIPTCFDQVKNQDELQVDCGGPCKPCCLADINIFGPVSAKKTDVENVYDYDFEAVSGKYLLYVGSNYKATAWIELNNEEIINPDDFVEELLVYEIDVSESNKLIIRMASDAGSSLVIWISNLCYCETDEWCPDTFECDAWCVPRASCSDSIRNQGEAGIDCGGPCDPCVEIPIVVKLTLTQKIANFVKQKYPIVVDIVIKGLDSAKKAWSFVMDVLGRAAPPVKNALDSFVGFVKESYWPFAKNVISKSWLFVEGNWLVFVYALSIVILLAGAVYSYRNYQKMLVYKGYVKYKEDVGKELRSRKITKTRELWDRKAEEKRKELEKARELRALKKETERRAIKNAKRIYVDVLGGFIEEAISSGYTKPQVKKELIKQGWPKQFVERYCNKFFKIHEELIKEKRKEVRKIKHRDLLERQLEHVGEEIDSSAEYIREELPMKWAKPSKGKLKLVEKKLRFKAEKVSSKELDKLEKQLMDIDKKIDTSVEYIKGELPMKWAKPSKEKLKLARKKLRFKKQEISEKDMAKLQKQLEKATEELKKLS